VSEIRALRGTFQSRGSLDTREREPAKAEETMSDHPLPGSKGREGSPERPITIPCGLPC
jgi:hypothetical protein